jgi:hypothetical protein
MANLAATYWKLGRYPEAEPLQSLVLEKQKQLLGADHPDTLRAMANLAATHQALGIKSPNTLKTQKKKKIFKRVWSWVLGIQTPAKQM